MKYFYDCEFIENGQTIDLISLGMVAENGGWLYAQNADCDFSKASVWVQDNVLPHLDWLGSDFRPMTVEGALVAPWYRYNVIGDVIKECFKTLGDDKPELWGYYSAYDHVALCQLYGPMIDLPKGFPMYTRDLKQWCDAIGNPALPQQGKGEHNALADARWNMQVYEFLSRIDFRG